MALNRNQNSHMRVPLKIVLCVHISIQKEVMLDVIAWNHRNQIVIEMPNANVNPKIKEFEEMVTIKTKPFRTNNGS